MKVDVETDLSFALFTSRKLQSSKPWSNKMLQEAFYNNLATESMANKMQ